MRGGGEWGEGETPPKDTLYYTITEFYDETGTLTDKIPKLVKDTFAKEYGIDLQYNFEEKRLWCDPKKNIRTKGYPISELARNMWIKYILNQNPGAEPGKKPTEYPSEKEYQKQQKKLKETGKEDFNIPIYCYDSFDLPVFKLIFGYEICWAEDKIAQENKQIEQILYGIHFADADFVIIDLSYFNQDGSCKNADFDQWYNAKSPTDVVPNNIIKKTDTVRLWGLARIIEHEILGHGVMSYVDDRISGEGSKSTKNYFERNPNSKMEYIGTNEVWLCNKIRQQIGLKLIRVFYHPVWFAEYVTRVFKKVCQRRKKA